MISEVQVPRHILSDLISSTRVLMLLIYHQFWEASQSLRQRQPYFKEKEPRIISYTYTKTIASKIFNFSSTLSGLDYHQFHKNPSQCECNNLTSHLYQPYGDVITGDLSIIPNSKLRDRVQKARNTESHAKLTGMKIYDFYVKLLTSMHCNEPNGKW